MNAFIKSYEVGSHGVETDVSITADEKLILFHDTKLTRTTNIVETFPERKDDPLHTFSYHELQKLDCGTWFWQSDPFSTVKNGVIALPPRNLQPATIPLLEDLLNFVKEKDWFINIEIKPLAPEKKDFPIIQKVIELLEKMRLEPHHFSISSFDHDLLTEAISLRPDIEVSALIGDNAPHDWGGFEFSTYTANVHLFNLEQLQQATLRGCQVNLYTVNREETMLYYLKNGVKKIITDFPQILARHLL